MLKIREIGTRERKGRNNSKKESNTQGSPRPYAQILPAGYSTPGELPIGRSHFASGAFIAHPPPRPRLTRGQQEKFFCSN